MKRFRGESRPIVNHIICTNAFGMGLDIPDVRLVIHCQQPASVEDYLQEFGRAGRDGKAAAAVIFYEGHEASREVGLLRFMADKTVASAGLSDEASAAMLKQRYLQISDLTGLLQSKSCFRRGIVQYFEGGSAPNRPGLATRILEWVFGTKPTPRRFRSCCDFCDAAEIEKLGYLPKVGKAVSVS